MKRHLIVTILLLSTGILFQACTGSDYGKYKLQTGNYSFVVTDSLGKHLVEGDMKLNRTELNGVSGSYEVTKKYVDKLSGMSMSKGIFEGTYDSIKGLVSLNLNPKMADANIFVTARIYRTSLAGEWIYSTIMGTIGRGNFVAEKVE